MTQLIACLTTGKGSWSEVSRIIDGADWEKVFLITNEFGKEKFNKKSNTELLVLNLEKPVAELSNDIEKVLKPKLSGLEVGLNLSSGTGSEHMAILSALIRCGVGFRIILSENNSLKEI